MVHGACPCQELCKESGAAFSSRTYVAEWPNLECVHAKVAFFSTVSFGIQPNHVYLASHESRPARSTHSGVRFGGPQHLRTCGG